MEEPNRIYRRVRFAPKPLRIAAGIALIVGGALGFLPVLGFWMIPLGLLVLSIDIPWVRRQARALRARLSRRAGGRESGADASRRPPR